MSPTRLTPSSSRSPKPARSRRPANSRTVTRIRRSVAAAALRLASRHERRSAAGTAGAAAAFGSSGLARRAPRGPRFCAAVAPIEPLVTACRVRARSPGDQLLACIARHQAADPHPHPLQPYLPRPSEGRQRREDHLQGDGGSGRVQAAAPLRRPPEQAFPNRNSFLREHGCAVEAARAKRGGDQRSAAPDRYPVVGELAVRVRTDARLPPAAVL